MAYRRIIVKNLSEFISELIGFTGKSDEAWYRGETTHYYHLEPSAYRYSEYTKSSGVMEMETIQNAQSDMLHIYETEKLELDLDWLSYLQHVGVPTRLLDWSLEFNTALYFAFESYIKSEAEPGSMPCIWTIKPGIFMKKLAQFLVDEPEPPFEIGGDEKVRVINLINNGTPMRTHSLTKDHLRVLDNIYLPMVSSYVNERVKMQSGCFIRFPLLNKRSEQRFKEYRLDNFITQNEIFSDCLAQFIFIYPNELLNELSILNLDRKRIYPEVENISRSIKRRLFEKKL